MCWWVIFAVLDMSFSVNLCITRGFFYIYNNNNFCSSAFPRSCSDITAFCCTIPLFGRTTRSNGQWSLLQFSLLYQYQFFSKILQDSRYRASNNNNNNNNNNNYTLACDDIMPTGWTPAAASPTLEEFDAYI